METSADSISRFMARLDGSLVKRVCGLLAKFFGLEIAIKATMMVTSLVIVRNMTKEQYGYYSLVNNFQDSLVLFCSMGVGAGLLAMGGGAIGNREKMGQIVTAAGRMRLLLFLVGAPVGIAAFAPLLLKNGCSPLQTTALIVLAILMLLQGIVIQMANFPFGLSGKYNTQQNGELLSGLIRLALTGLLLFTVGLQPVPVIVVSLVAAAVTLTFYSVRKSAEFVQIGVPAPEEVQTRFRRFTFQSLPSTLNAMFQGQVAMWLMALFGTVSNVAELGALTRIGLILSIPSALIPKIAAPRLAREKDPGKLLKLWIVIASFGIAGGSLFYISVRIFHRPILALLGDQYSNLSEHLGFYAAYLGYIFATTSIFSIVQARGWMKGYWAVPFMVMGTQALSLFWVPINSITGVITFRWIGDVAGALVMGVLLWRGMRGKGQI